MSSGLWHWELNASVPLFLKETKGLTKFRNAFLARIYLGLGVLDEDIPIGV